MAPSIFSADWRNDLLRWLTSSFQTTSPTISGTPVFSGVPSLAGGGLAFPATQVPSAGANVLDDYEEGTWTPAFSFGTGGIAGFLYSNQTGTYTKIGRLVFATFDLTVSTLGSGSGTATLIGLPFTVGGVASGAVSLYSAMSSISGALTILTQPSSVILQIKIGGTTGTSDLNKTNMSVTTRMSGSVVYQV